MAKKPQMIKLEDAVAALQAIVDNPKLSPEVPADGQVHRRVEPVPVYWARCSDCASGHGFPSFGEQIGREKAQDWLNNHRRAYCPAKKVRVA